MGPLQFKVPCLCHLRYRLRVGLQTDMGRPLTKNITHSLVNTRLEYTSKVAYFRKLFYADPSEILANWTLESGQILFV